MYEVRPAHLSEHKELCSLAKTSPYTKDFSNRLMFSSDAAYERGWIRVCVDPLGTLLGFTCVRHKSRGERKTMLYFITVDPEVRSCGVGRLLVEDLMRTAPAGIVELNVAKDNERAVAFYEREGFRKVGEGLDGDAWRMEKRR